MDTLNIKLACVIAHLAEYIETGERADFDAAESLMRFDDVRQLFKDAREDELLPRPRKPVAFIDDCVKW